MGGIVLGAGLTSFVSYLEHRRRRADEIAEAAERETAVLHGAFALCNFIVARLNDWDEDKSSVRLARLTVAQPYLAKLIDRSPHGSDRLMVSLVDLGLHLESLMFVAGYAVGSEVEANGANSEVAAEVVALGRAAEFVQILISGELPFMTDEEIAQISVAIEKQTAQ